MWTRILSIEIHFSRWNIWIILGSAIILDKCSVCFISRTLCPIGLESKFNPHLPFTVWFLPGALAACFPIIPMIISEIDQNIPNQEYALYLKLGNPYQSFLFLIQNYAYRILKIKNLGRRHSDILSCFFCLFVF